MSQSCMLEIFHFLGAVFLGLEKKEHKHLKKALCCIAQQKGSQYKALREKAGVYAKKRLSKSTLYSRL